MHRYLIGGSLETGQIMNRGALLESNLPGIDLRMTKNSFEVGLLLVRPFLLIEYFRFLDALEKLIPPLFVVFLVYNSSSTGAWVFVCYDHYAPSMAPCYLCSDVVDLYYTAQLILPILARLDLLS